MVNLLTYLMCNIYCKVTCMKCILFFQSHTGAAANESLRRPRRLKEIESRRHVAAVHSMLRSFLYTSSCLHRSHQLSTRTSQTRVWIAPILNRNLSTSLHTKICRSGNSKKFSAGLPGCLPESSQVQRLRLFSSSSCRRDKTPSKPDPDDEPKFSMKVFLASFRSENGGSSSFRKLVALAKPERKSLAIAIGLLMVSSTVSMSIPFTVGKLIDYFTSPTHVRVVPFHALRISKGFAVDSASRKSLLIYP